MLSRTPLTLLLFFLGAPEIVQAQVPTASMPADEDDSPAASAAVAPAVAPSATSAPVVSAPAVPAAVPGPPVPSVPIGATPTAAPTAALAKPTGADGPPNPMNALPSALVSGATKSSSGYARLSLQLKEAGSIAYVFPHAEDPERYASESALMHCSATCTLELPHGEYSIRVETAGGVRSYGELSLQSARWVQVTPARQVVRDLGFVLGVVGVVSTVLGTALLADAICDTCTTAARNIGGAFGLGLGIPMTAIGWSLYYIHRTASVEERVLTQTASPWSLNVNVASLPEGAVVSGGLLF